MALPGVRRLSSQVAHGLVACARLAGYVREWRAYDELAEGTLRLRDAYPLLLDRSTSTPYDPHYLHQSVWAAHAIVERRPREHVDVGSLALFVAMLSASVPVTFIDIRPLDLALDNLHPVKGSLERLPLVDGSVQSLSCLHVIEHVGLGRYGDPLDPEGSQQACRELARVLEPGGNLYLSAPIGSERVCFNAHRVHDPRTILSYVPELDLVEFVVVDDDGALRTDLGVDGCSTMSYGCGLFRFERPVDRT